MEEYIGAELLVADQTLSQLFGQLEVYFKLYHQKKLKVKGYKVFVGSFLRIA